MWYAKRMHNVFDFCLTAVSEPQRVHANESDSFYDNKYVFLTLVTKGMVLNVEGGRGQIKCQDTQSTITCVR